MRILMITSDPKATEVRSVVSVRINEYAKLVDELKIVSVASVVGKNKFRVMWDAYRKCEQILKQWHKRDSRIVVTSQDGVGHALVGLLSLQFKFGWEAQVHTDILSPYFSRESWKNKLHIIAYYMAVKRASGLRVVSERIKHSLILKWKVNPSKISVQPIYVDPTKFAQSADPEKLNTLRNKYSQFNHIILMVSRLTSEKNIPLAFDVLPRVHKRYPKAGLIIAGSGPLESELKLKAKSSQLEASIVFLQWQNPDQLGQLYKMADVYLLTSNFEGYGLTLIEAAVSGTSIVTTDVGVVGEVVNAHNSLIASVGDADKLAQHICFLFQNKSASNLMRERLREVGTTLPDKFTVFKTMNDNWSIVSKKVIGGLPIVVKYIFSGGTAAAVDIGLLFFLTHYGGLWYLASASIAFLIAFWVSFYLQKHWTFEDRSEEVHRQAATYFVISIINLSINALFMYTLVDLIHIYYILAQIITGGLIAFSSFFIYRKFVFKKL